MKQDDKTAGTDRTLTTARVIRSRTTSSVRNYQATAEEVLGGMRVTVREPRPEELATR